MVGTNLKLEGAHKGGLHPRIDCIGYPVLKVRWIDARVLEDYLSGRERPEKIMTYGEQDGGFCTYAMGLAWARARLSCGYSKHKNSSQIRHFDCRY